MKNKSKLFLAVGMVSLSIVPCFSSSLNVSADVGDFDNTLKGELIPISYIKYFEICTLDNEVYQLSVNGNFFSPSPGADYGALINDFTIERAFSTYYLKIKASLNSYTAGTDFWNTTEQANMGYLHNVDYDVTFSYNNTLDSAWSQVDYLKIEFVDTFANFANGYNNKYGRNLNPVIRAYTYSRTNSTFISYMGYNAYQVASYDTKLFSNVNESENIFNYYDTYADQQLIDFSSGVNYARLKTNTNITYFLNGYYDTTSQVSYKLRLSYPALFENYFPKIDSFLDVVRADLSINDSWNFSDFLSTSVGGFLDFEMFGMSLADILYIIIGISLLIVILKIFLGG